MNTNELCSKLQAACTSGVSALRAVVRLVPAGGNGDKVAPPTHDKGAYAFEKRSVGGRSDVQTVLLDSVQSQANRFEEALLDAVQSGDIRIPLLQMDIPGRRRLTSLSVPHRIHDAIFRDSRYNGVRFRDSSIGQQMVASRAWNATAMFQLCPTALLFGTWDSQGNAGVNSAKFARSLVSEIIALDAVRGVRTSSRIDPLGIKAMPGAIYQSKEQQWTLDPNDAIKSKSKPQLYGAKGTPSDINHGNIPPTLTDPEKGAGGVTFGEARQTIVLSFTQLRKLRFPVDGDASDQLDVAGRSVLAALGILAVTLQIQDGYQLRSRCQLVPVTQPEFEWIGATVADKETATISAITAREALETLYARATGLGLVWQEEPIVLDPEEKLLRLIELSDESTEVEE